MNDARTPKVSVIMNCLNGRRFLREAIESVVNQTYNDWEIVFWDNVSSDGSGAIAQEFSDRVRYFRGEKMLPLGAARNEAIARAGGQYIAILDCDDTWLPEKLQLQVEMLDANRSLGLVFSDAFITDAGGSVTDRFFARTPVPPGDPYLQLLIGPNFIPCLTAVIRRSVLEGVGGFKASLTYSEDYELFLRIAARYPLAHVDRPLAAYRLHGNNATGRGSTGTLLEAIAVIREARHNGPGLGLRQRTSVARRLFMLRCKLVALRLRIAMRGLQRVPSAASARRIDAS